MSAPLFTGSTTVLLDPGLTILDVMADLDPDWLAAYLASDPEDR